MFILNPRSANMLKKIYCILKAEPETISGFADFVKELEKSDSICIFDTEGFKRHIQKLYITDDEITFVLKNGIELEIEKQEVP